MSARTLNSSSSFPTDFSNEALESGIIMNNSTGFLDRYRLRTWLKINNGWQGGKAKLILGIVSK